MLAKLIEFIGLIALAELVISTNQPFNPINHQSLTFDLRSHCCELFSLTFTRSQPLTLFLSSSVIWVLASVLYCFIQRPLLNPGVPVIEKRGWCHSLSVLSPSGGRR